MTKSGAAASGTAPARVDVVVVGYGPVGMVTAALLGRAGHRVVVVERFGGLYNLPRAATFDDETMRTLALLGVAEQLLPDLRVQPIYEWRNGAGELLIEQHYAAQGRSGWAEWYMMYQPALEKALDGICRAAPSVEIRHASPVIGIEPTTDGVTVVVDGPSGREMITASYVVACDGGNSFVRRALGIGEQDYGFAEPWMVCDFAFRRAVGIPNALQLGDPRRPTSIISIGRSHHRFSFMLDSVEDFATERDPARVWERVVEYLCPDDAELIRVATYTFRSLVADRWRAGRIVLAGDAAHQMPPFLGQGMVSGIRDAQNLAFKLDLILRGICGQDLLDTYQLEREPHVRALIEKGIELGRAQTIRDPELAALRDRELLARRASSRAPDKLRFPPLVDGFLATTSAPGRGDLSVQGVVENDRRRARLDEVAGGGFQLLLGSGPFADVADSVAMRALAESGVHVVLIGDGEPVSHPFATPVRDVEGTYRKWFAEWGCSAVAVRPDFYVYGTANGVEATRALIDELLDALGRSVAPESLEGVPAVRA